MLRTLEENAKANHLTTEEVQAVVALWAAEQKSGESPADASKPVAVADIAEALEITVSDAERLMMAARRVERERTASLRKHHRRLAVASAFAGAILLGGLWVNSFLPKGQHHVIHILPVNQWGLKAQMDVIETPYRFVFPNSYRLQDVHGMVATDGAWETHMTSQDYEDFIASHKKKPAYFTVFAAGQGVRLGVFELDSYPEPHLSRDIIKLLAVSPKAK